MLPIEYYEYVFKTIHKVGEKQQVFVFSVNLCKTNIFYLVKMSEEHGLAVRVSRQPKTGWDKNIFSAATVQVKSIRLFADCRI